MYRWAQNERPCFAYGGAGAWEGWPDLSFGSARTTIDPAMYGIYVCTPLSLARFFLAGTIIA